MKRAVFLDRDGVLNRAEVRDGRPFPRPGCRMLRSFRESRTRVAGWPRPAGRSSS